VSLRSNTEEKGLRTGVEEYFEEVVRMMRMKRDSGMKGRHDVVIAEKAYCIILKCIILYTYITTFYFTFFFTFFVPIRADRKVRTKEEGTKMFRKGVAVFYVGLVPISGSLRKRLARAATHDRKCSTHFPKAFPRRDNAVLGYVSYLCYALLAGLVCHHPVNYIIKRRQSLWAAE
jgi:hypothetical protein